MPGSLLGRQRHPEVDLALLMAILGIAVQLPRLPDHDVAMEKSDKPKDPVTDPVTG